MRISSAILATMLCLTEISCQPARDRIKPTKAEMLSHVRLLERIENSGNRYRRAIDLLRLAGSSSERSLAEGHLEVSRQFLEIEFQLADTDSKEIALKESESSSAKSSPAATSDDLQYGKIVEEVWKLSAELDEAKKRFAKAQESLKRATSPELFQRAQRAMDLAQKELMIADKKLDLAGSNLEIQDFQRKKNTSKDPQIITPTDRMKLLKQELLDFSNKAAANSTLLTNGVEQGAGQLAHGNRPNGLWSDVREWLDRNAKIRTLRQIEEETLEVGQMLRASLTDRLQELERLQLEHKGLNQKTASTYNLAYDLVKRGGKQQEVKGLLDEAEIQMRRSTQLDEQKELMTRAINLNRKQELLVQEDEGKVSDWEMIASEERRESLNRVAGRAGIVTALIFLILLISFYLKRLPYKFIQEGKNAFYFRKLVSFSAGLLIGAIILLNFISDFGSISAVIGLAGAGLAIALQDPIVCLAGWFLVVGKFGISVGDRVEINNVKGDVIDIGLLRLAVLEVGNWVSTEQSTGRVVFFPNSFIFKNHYYNYSTGNSFIWDEIKVTLTYESDWSKAKQMLEAIAIQASREFVGEAREISDHVARRFHINLGALTPIVYVSIGESGVELLLRYLTAIRKRRMTHDRICREILEAFGGDPRMALAYPTRRTIAETKSTTEKPSVAPTNETQQQDMS